jgi:hypothetical protein
MINTIFDIFEKMLRKISFTKVLSKKIIKILIQKI